MTMVDAEGESLEVFNFYNSIWEIRSRLL